LDAGMLLRKGALYTVVGLSTFYDGSPSILIGHRDDNIEGWRVTRFERADDAKPEVRGAEAWLPDDSEMHNGRPEESKPDPYELPRAATHPLLGRHDPYTGRFLSKEMVAYAMQKADDEIEGRRARLVAALKAELGRPVTQPRFPSEARSDRVTGYRRW